MESPDASQPQTPDWAIDNLFGPRKDQNIRSDSVVSPSTVIPRGSLSDAGSDESKRTVIPDVQEYSQSSTQQTVDESVSPISPASQYDVWTEIHEAEGLLISSGYQLWILSILNLVMVMYYTGSYEAAESFIAPAFQQARDTGDQFLISRTALWLAIIYDKLGILDEIPWILGHALLLQCGTDVPDKVRLLKMLKKYCRVVDTWFNELKAPEESGLVGAQGVEEQHVNTEPTEMRQDGRIHFQRSSRAYRIMEELEAELGEQAVSPTINLHNNSAVRMSSEQQITPNSIPLDADISTVSPKVLQEPVSATDSALDLQQLVLELQAKNHALEEALLPLRPDLVNENHPSRPQSGDSMFQDLLADTRMPVYSALGRSSTEQAQLFEQANAEHSRVSQFYHNLRIGENPRRQASSPLTDRIWDRSVSEATEKDTTIMRGANSTTADEARATDTPGGNKLEGLVKRRKSAERRRSVSFIDTSVGLNSSQSPAAESVLSETPLPLLDNNSPVTPSPLRRSSIFDEA